MARNFATSFLTPYRGAIGATPIRFCDAKAVRLDFSWSQYGIDLGTSRSVMVNPGVTFDVNPAPSNPLPIVQGVFIDNTACASPVYLRAEDTGHVLTCADGTSAFFPILTGGTAFTLFIESVAAPFENNETTRLFLVDKPFPGYSDFQFAEFIPATQVSGQNAFAATVQADQYAYEFIRMEIADSTANRANVDGASATLIPAETRFPNTLVLGSVVASVAIGRSTCQRPANIRFYNSSSNVGRELFKGTTHLRPYNQPINPTCIELVNIQGAALRLDGTLPLRCIPRLNAIEPGSEGTNSGASYFAVDVTICYARIRTPTT